MYPSTAAGEAGTLTKSGLVDPRGGSSDFGGTALSKSVCNGECVLFGCQLVSRRMSLARSITGLLIVQ